MSDNTDATPTTDVATPTPAPKAKVKRTSNAVPKAVRAAGKTQEAAKVARAIGKHIGATIEERDFRNRLRRKHGYVSGKVGPRLNLDDAKLLASLIKDERARKARKA